MREIPNYVAYWPYIMYIMPYYGENNRTNTEVCYFDGSTEQYECRCEYVVDQLAVALRVPLDIVKDRMEKILEQDKAGSSRKVPIVMGEGFCLVPLKFREELVPKTGTIGLGVMQYVASVDTLPDGSRITFKNRNVSMQVVQRKRTVDTQLEQAKWHQIMYDFEKDYWAYERCIAQKTLQRKIHKQQERS